MSLATKAAAYGMVTKEDRQNCYSAILRAIGKHPGCSRADIQAVTGLRLATVCARVHELMQDKIIVPLGFKRDPLTGRNVETLIIKVNI